MKVIRTYEVRVPPKLSAERYNLEQAMIEDGVERTVTGNGILKFTNAQVASYLASEYDVGNFTEGTTVTEEVTDA